MKDSFETLRDKTIESYRKLLNQGLALDACRVQGKMRSMILRDPVFVRETRAIKAEKYLNEIEEIEDIYSAAQRLGDDDDGSSWDDSSGRDGGRGPRGSRKKTSDKDALAMQLKAASMRRELMQLTADNAADNEESAVNFFFTALTREEMESLKQVEFHAGSSDDDASFAAMKGEDEQDVAAKAKKRKQETEVMYGRQDTPDEDMFVIGEDGVLRERGSV